ncbi:MAG: Bax inhibitor-1 family protein [Gemmatimonadaceae bacterium]
MGISIPAGGGVLVRTGVERAVLVRRTYAIVFVSVLVTIGGAALGLTQPALMGVVARHPFLTFLLVLAPLFLALRMRKVFPANLGLTFLFTLAEGVWIAPLLLAYERSMPGVVGQAAVLTAGTFGVLTVYAFLSRRDFSAWGSFLSVGVWVLLGTMLLNLFFKNPAAHLWISAVGLLIFSGLVIYDTWKIRNVYGPDDYVEAAVNIYLDILNIFLFLLSLLGGRRD